MIIFLCMLFCVGALQASESDVHAHLLIHDYQGAVSEAKKALTHDPNSKTLWEAYIESLAKNGDEKEMIAAWQQYLMLFPKEKENRYLLENMAWGVIEQGSRSASPVIRLFSVLGGFYGNDSRGVNLLHKHARDKSALVRAAVVQLSSKLRDQKLKEEVKRLLKNERNWQVKVEAIRASGSMKIVEVKEELISMIGSPRSYAEEKSTATQALVNLIETPDRSEIAALVKSDRAGLRALGCQVVTHAELKEHLDLIYPLLQDHHAGVRATAIHTLAALNDSNAHLIEPLLTDGDPQVAITAAWAITLFHPQEGQGKFIPWLNHRKKEIRRLAAAALASTGKYGFPLTERTFYATTDPYVKMNLALGMIGQRVSHQIGCKELCHCCTEMNDRWMWEEKPPFRVLAPSEVKPQGMIPNYPEAVNQVTHLEILNILAIMEEPTAQDAIKQFLQKKNWGITGMASALLLTEGDESAIELVQNLLNDPNQKVKQQAALILALWGEGERALSVLQEAYPTADRETKERILEGIGRVGSPSSIPFLVERLGESHQTLRIIAASSLIQALYH